MVDLVTLPLLPQWYRRVGKVAASSLMKQVEQLDFDQALFVTLASLTPDDPEFRRAILGLRFYLKRRLVGMSVAVLEDFDKAGAWVYKRHSTPGGGAAISPAKEAEVRRRQIAAGPTPQSISQVGPEPAPK